MALSLVLSSSTSTDLYDATTSTNRVARRRGFARMRSATPSPVTSNVIPRRKREKNNMSASVVRATVRAVSKRKILPTRAALTLVSGPPCRLTRTLKYTLWNNNVLCVFSPGKHDNSRCISERLIRVTTTSRCGVTVLVHTSLYCYAYISNNTISMVLLYLSLVLLYKYGVIISKFGIIYI